MNEKQLLVLEELKSLALRYYACFNKLMPITGELGELYAIKELNLEANTSTHFPGYDAVDKKGLTYQIKSAMDVSKFTTSFRPIKLEANWDVIVFVTVSSSYELLEIWGSIKEDMLDNSYLQASKSFTKHKSITLSNVRKICIQLYPSDI